MGGNEVVEAVVRVAHPRQEVVDLATLRRDALAAVEASAILRLEQRFTHPVEADTAGAEEEFVEPCCLHGVAGAVGHEGGPPLLDDRAQDTGKTDQPGADARLQAESRVEVDGADTSLADLVLPVVVVQEPILSEAGAGGQALQLGERHANDGGGDASFEGCERLGFAPLGLGDRGAGDEPVGSAVVGDLLHEIVRLRRMAQEHGLGVGRRPVRDGLRPIELEDAPADPEGVELAGRLAASVDGRHALVDEGEEHGELVGRRVTAGVEQRQKLFGEDNGVIVGHGGGA